MSNTNIIYLNKDAVRNSYGVLLKEIHARLAEVASQHTRRQLDSFDFVQERAPFVPVVVSYHDANRDARRLQAEFDLHAEWQGLDTYVLKLDIDSLASVLKCPTAVRNQAFAQQQHAAPARKPAVHYKKQRKVVPAALAA